MFKKYIFSFVYVILEVFVGLFFVVADVIADDYIRISNDNQGYPQSLDTAAVRFSGQYKNDFIQIDLISALHVGEKSYYDQLNKLFKQYDALLYELVAPKGAAIQKGGTNDASAISIIQMEIRDMLALTFQLEEIDYSAANFVHADFTPEELFQSMRAQKDSFISTMSRVLAVSIKQANSDDSKSDNFDLMLQLIQRPSERRTIKIRRIFARQFSSADELIEAINGPSGSAIIDGRNRKALSVLKEELKAGKRRLAIFYGAAHLPGLKRLIEKELKMRQVGVRWIEAWNLRLPE